MARYTKIATCCYCGTRAALVLGKDRHELVCSGCGAPLHNLKQLPQGDVDPAAHRPEVIKPTKSAKKSERKYDPRRKKKKKPKKSLGRFLFEEAFDALEDIFD